MFRHASAAALLCAALLAGCGPSPGVAISPYPPVPAPQAEAIPKPPVTGETLVWQPGYWDWTGQDYAWRSGQYVPAAGHGSAWQPGWWNRINGGWRWEQAHWTDR